MRTNPFEEITLKLEEIQQDLQELKSKPDPELPKAEKYLTVDQVCDLLSVSRVSIWNWDKKGITTPVRIGNLKRYRLSDIEKMGRLK